MCEKVKNVMVINGPNLNLLGLREKEIYGSKSYNDLVEFIKESSLALGFKTDVFQSNHEGDIVEMIQGAYGVYDAIVINPAAYTHTSIAILDALKGVNIPTVEVHLSDISSREEFRKLSYVSLFALKTISGRGFDGYRMAFEYLKPVIE